jgi:hypothetical protein
MQGASQGFQDNRGFNEARTLLGQMEKVDVAGFDVASKRRGTAESCEALACPRSRG